MLQFGPTCERLSTLVDKARTVKKPRCLNPTCALHGHVESTGIIRYGFYRTTAGKRRRSRCIGCGQTFSTTTGTPYSRLQHRRATFDSVVTLRVEGGSLSAIARIERLAWNTVARWLERAAAVCRHCSHGRTTGFVATELQADEIRSFTGGKTRPAWVCAAIEVWSRLWTSTVVGRRSSRNTLALVRDVAPRMKFAAGPLIVTDGFEFYGTVIRRVVGPAALDAQVIKTRRHDRVVRVERRAVIGAAWRLDQALTPSEDSSTVNTSFIERLNLTIRQRSAYLSRRTLSHARSTDTLEAHLALLRCYYNFVRPHGALKFGRETRTPAMQAGLATRRLTLRDIFVSLRSLVASLSDVPTLAHSRRMAAAAVMYMPVAA